MQGGGCAMLSRMPRAAAAPVLAVLASAALVIGPAVAAPAAAPAAVAASRVTTGPSVAGASGSGSIAGQLGRDFQSAWQITRGKGVTVAVLSSGVDGSVPTLAGAVTTGPDFVRRGKPSLIFGTLVASMIAGTGPTLSSPFGIRGLAPDAHILSVRVYPDTDEAGSARFYGTPRSEKAFVNGVRYAADHGADVIYTDEWVYDASQAMDSAVQYALSKGIAVVAAVAPPASGDNYTVSYPTGIAGVVGVGAVGLNGKRLKQYTARSMVLVSAPGIKVPATGPGDTPYLWWGSPVATAWVAAAVALVKSEYPHASPAIVARAIGMSARRHPPGGYDTSIGFGIINPAGALAATGQLVKLSAVATPGQGAVAPAGHFGGGPSAARIEAIHHNLLDLAGFAAAILLGIACLGLAAALWTRGRRRARAVRLAPVGWPPLPGGLGGAAAEGGFGGPQPGAYGPPPGGGYGGPHTEGPYGPPPEGYDDQPPESYGPPTPR